MDSVFTRDVKSWSHETYENIPGLLWILIPAIISLLVFNIGNTIKKSVVFIPNSFNLYHLYASQFVHFDFQHLSSCLLIYVIFVLAAYMIFARSHHKPMFWKSYAVFLLLAPLIGSLSWVLASQVYSPLGNLQIYGFSTITSAAIGLFGFSIILYLKSLNAEKNSAFLAIFTFGVAFVPAIYGQLLPSALLFLLCILSFIFSTQNSVLEKRHLTIILVWLILYQIGVQTMFPPEIFYDKFAINIPSHYAGFSTGLILPMFFLKSKPEPKPEPELTPDSKNLL
ncbi:MAG: hypothetical protein R6U44_07820 [Archaeoglobaceae archaeon]